MVREMNDWMGWLFQRYLSFSKKYLVLKCVPFLVLILSGGARAQSYDFSSVSNQFEGMLSSYNSNVVVIVEQNELGEIFRYERGGGSQDVRVPIASASKWLSAAIMLACVERGYFELDDPIGMHLPLFSEMNKGDITIRQCFAMTSGLSLDDPAYESSNTLSLAESVDLIASNTPVLYTPGTRLDYQGDGMQVVGRICEVRSGKSWSELADELLFEPLEMTNAADYGAFDLNPFIAGGARCSASDYLKFLRMVANNGLAENGRVVLSSRSVQEFFWNRTALLPETINTPWGPSDYYPSPVPFRRPDYSCGCWVLATDTNTYETLEVASPGATGAWPWVDRKRGLVGVIFMYSPTWTGFEDTYDNNLHVLQLLREEIDRVGLPPPAEPGPPSISTLSNGYVSIEWDGLREVSLSTNLIDWIAVKWMRSPLIEQPAKADSDSLYYRLQTVE